MSSRTPNALMTDAMTSGKSVYPMMHTDWKNDLAFRLAFHDTGSNHKRRNRTYDRRVA